MADESNSEEIKILSLDLGAVVPDSTTAVRNSADAVPNPKKIEISEEERHHIEEERKKEEAHLAEETRIAAEESRKARLDAAWRDMEDKRFEYDRIAQEKRALEKAENIRFVRNAVLGIVCIVATWQAWPFIAPFLITPPPPVAAQPPQTADQATAPAPESRGVTELEEGMKLFDGKDFANAAEAFKKAAEQGNPKAQTNLGDMYAEGKGVMQDFQQAITWHLKAAEQGSSESQSGLGAIYAEGKGVPKDYIEADKWFQIAGEAPGEEAKKRREALEQEMTPEQRAEAAKRAGEWAKAHPR